MRLLTILIEEKRREKPKETFHESVKGNPFKYLFPTRTYPILSSLSYKPMMCIYAIILLEGDIRQYK